MTYDPLSEVVDESLPVSIQTVQQLEELRQAEKFADLPGTNTADEQARLAQVLNELLERLIDGIVENPTKLWVIQQFQVSLQAVELEDTEGRDHFGLQLERIMDILHIESSDGVLSFYL